MGLSVQDSFDCLPLFIETHADAIKVAKDNEIIIAGSVAITPKLIAAYGQLARSMREAGKRVSVLVGANASPAADDREFVKMLNAQAGDSFDVVSAGSTVEWLGRIASAELLISGRFHYSIAAACLQTPFIALDSNTPKMDGLAQRLMLNNRLQADAPDLEQQLISMAKNGLQFPHKMTASVERVAELRDLARANFRALEAAPASN
jgi:polysaccharide pyruvyl transferase WcaK-like protein